MANSQWWAVFQMIIQLRLANAFSPSHTSSFARPASITHVHSSEPTATIDRDKVDEASQILAEWDRSYSPDTAGNDLDLESFRPKLVNAVLVLNEKARQERTADSTMGRCLLGICASTAEEGLATLKSWVTKLELPRGLLHGMDKDGVPLQLDGAVYIKYNSGGVYTFADVRKSQMGFDALWKPGDAMLEEYDGSYRGVYFQVELADGEFRQYLVPHDIFYDEQS